MFASAAIIDSMRKDERRRELDQQLDEAKQELAELQEQSKVLRSRSGINPDGLTSKQMDILWRAMKQVYNERPYKKEIAIPATITASELIDNLRHNYYQCQPESILHDGRQIDYAELERAIMEESESCSAPGARTETQLRHETSRFLNMIREIFTTAGRMDRSRVTRPSFSEVHAMLQDNHTNYTFRSTDPEAARKTTQTLNESLRKLLASKLPFKEKMGRLCYNMMVSPHVPDIHTYNTLIAGFDKCGYYQLSEAVIYSFFYGRYIRPTESTYVAILNHYKLVNRPGQFLLNVARITGLDDKVGAKMRRRHYDSLDRIHEQRWATSNVASKTLSGDYIMEHMPLNRALVEEMMSGLLRFKLFDQAAVLFVGCLKSGVMLGGDMVRRLLDECIAALDWSAGMELVRAMSQFGRQWRQLMMESGTDAEHLISRIYVLLDLCGIGAPGQDISSSAARLQVSEQRLESFLDSLETMGASMEPSVLMRDYEPSKSRMLQLEALWKEYVKVRKTTVSIESKLLNADHPLEFREDCAAHIAESALARCETLSAEFQQLTLAQAKREVQKETPKPVANHVRVARRQRGHVGTIGGLERELPMMIWSRQLDSRPQLMANSFGSA